MPSKYKSGSTDTSKAAALDDTSVIIVIINLLSDRNNFVEKESNEIITAES